MYLIFSYVGTQIWGMAENHVLLLTSRKSCLMTSRGKLVHKENMGGMFGGARGDARQGKELGELVSDILDSRRAPSSGHILELPTSTFGACTRKGVVQRLTTIAAKATVSQTIQQESGSLRKVVKVTR